jgi:aspartyl-tRNA synthetase
MDDAGAVRIRKRTLLLSNRPEQAAKETEMMTRTDSCGELRAADVDRTAILMGWVHRRRDHGGVIFIDLRDTGGVTQVVFRPEAAELQDQARRLRGEFVIAVRGQVRHRPEGMVNAEMATGEIELEAEELEILSESKPPPFLIEEDSGALEDLRLTYRYLDLRRPPLQRAIRMRHRIYQAVREYLDQRGLVEIDTPILTRSTPEGARDYLVPSRTYPGEFYALPQSPQIYKQLLMVAGFERYYQIARCFRDEDLRADRQPEFTQVDIEMSFVQEEDIYRLTEGLFQHVFRKVLGVELTVPFPRLDYWEAMNRFGVDKPDIRFGLELTDLGDLFTGTDFGVFSTVLEAGGQIKGINASGCGSYSRKDIDGLTETAKTAGAKGLITFKAVAEDGRVELQSGVAKYLTGEQLEAMSRRLKAAGGDLILVVAGPPRVVAAALGALRLEVARRQEMIPDDEWAFCWVVDFPLFGRDPHSGEIEPEHHPFTGFREEDAPLFDSDPTGIRSRAYDIVLNGVELGSGSIRIHRRDQQQRVFETLGLSRRQIEDRFGFLLQAFDYGVPPHGGIAPGLDRLVMMMARCDSIREVIPFPKTTRGASLMSGAPSSVDQSQLDELGLVLKETPDEREGKK